MFWTGTHLWVNTSNLQRSTAGEKISWLNVHLIQVRQSTPKSLFVAYSFNEASFIEIDIQANSTRQGTKMGSWPENLKSAMQRRYLSLSRRRQISYNYVPKELYQKNFIISLKHCQLTNKWRTKFQNQPLMKTLQIQIQNKYVTFKEYCISNLRKCHYASA